MPGKVPLTLSREWFESNALLHNNHHQASRIWKYPIYPKSNVRKGVVVHYCLSFIPTSEYLTSVLLCQCVKLWMKESAQRSHQPTSQNFHLMMLLNVNLKDHQNDYNSSLTHTCFGGYPALWRQLGGRWRCCGDHSPACSSPQSWPWSPQPSHGRPWSAGGWCNDCRDTSV